MSPILLGNNPATQQLAQSLGEIQMNIDKLREELAEDEGCKYEIYLDHLGLANNGNWSPDYQG